MSTSERNSNINIFEPSIPSEMPDRDSSSCPAAPIRILVISGPTAVGKTAFAIAAARRYDGEIVSCDSMQVYRHMDIGSAKPSPDERALVPHHLIDCIDPACDGDGAGSFSAARYAALASEAIADIHGRGKLPVIAGGTGLYLNAILYDMDFGAPPADPALREHYEEIAETRGSQLLHDMLRQWDPEAAERIHPNNVKKVIRALERLSAGEKSVHGFDGVRQENPLYDPLLIGLVRDRKELYDRINARTEQMIGQGLVEEVGRLMDMGLSEDNISMLGIGYKELIPYLHGTCSLVEATEKIQRNTRHLAKRQLTWFRRYDKMFWLNISDYENDQAAMEAMFAWADPKL